MQRPARTITALIAALILIILIPVLWFRLSGPQDSRVTTSTSTSSDSNFSITPSNNTSGSPSNNTLTSQTVTPQPVSTPTASTPSGPQSAALIIPVADVTADKLVDTYTQSRSNGRVHDAIDIVAPHNTHVIAAASGTIVRLFQSKLGGTTIYELGPDGHTVYYYAHLDRYADGVTQGEQVQPGELIGYVGDTGDAGPGNYHLHFAIWKIQDPKKFWDGENVNPYPILRQVK